MTAGGGEVEREDDDVVEDAARDDADEALDALAYESATHNGSLVPRSLLDFLR